MKLKNYQLRNIVFIIILLDLFTLFNSIVPFYNLDAARLLIYLFQFLIILTLARHFYFYIKINNKMHLLKDNYFKLFLILSIILFSYVIIINTILSFILKGGFNLLAVLINLLLLLLHNILFLYFYKNKIYNVNTEEFNFLILRNSFKNDNDEYNLNHLKEIRLIRLISSLFPFIFSFVITFIILAVEIITSILSLTIIGSISFLFLIGLFIFNFIYNEKHQIFKRSKLIISYIVKALLLALLILITFYYKENYLSEALVSIENNNEFYLFTSLFALAFALVYQLFNYVLSSMNYYDESYIRYLIRNNKK